MPRLHDLMGQELLEYGLALTEQLEYKKTLSGLPGDPSVCEFCSRTLETEHVINLPGHPAADAKGDVYRRLPCEQPECVAKREEIRAQYSRAKEREVKGQFQQKLERAGIGSENMAGLVFENFDTEWPKEERHRKPLRDMLDKMQAWAQGPEGLVILSGPYGIGKTRLAVAALRYFLSHSASSGFLLACVEAWSATKALWGAPRGIGTLYRGISVTESVLNERTQQAGLLVIDDLDKVIPSQAWLQWVLSILNYRVDHKLPTVMTLNVPLNQLEAWLTRESKAADTGRALYSRMMAMRQVAISCPADQPDYREYIARMVS